MQSPPHHYHTHGELYRLQPEVIVPEDIGDLSHRWEVMYCINVYESTGIKLCILLTVDVTDVSWRHAMDTFSALLAI